MMVSDQMQHFSGCVYIETHHKVMMPDGRLLDQQRFRVVKGGHEFQMTADGQGAGAWTKDAFEAFTQSRVHRFPQAKGVRYSPDAPFAEVDHFGRVNALMLPDVPMSDGDVTPFLVHLTKLLPIERDRRILLSWMARMVQSRGRKFDWAVVIQGAEGNGKTFLLECLRRAVGETVTHLPNPEDMHEKYNAYLEGNLLIGVEEIHMRGRRDLLDRLKKYLNSRVIEIRAMGADKYMADNLTNWMFLTNFKDAVFTHQGDRRYSIFFTAQQEPEDLARDGMAGQRYFPGLWDWARQGGFAAVAGYLNTFQIDPEFDPLGAAHRAPETSSRTEAIRASFGPVEEALLDAIAEERVGFRGGWLSSYYARKVVEENYRRVGPKIIAEAINNIGLVSFGRATRKIWNEGNAKPTLYFNDNIVQNPIFSDYCEKQGYIEENLGRRDKRGREDNGPEIVH